MTSSRDNFSFQFTDEREHRSLDLSEQTDRHLCAPLGQALSDASANRYDRLRNGARQNKWHAQRAGRKLIIATAFASGVIVPSLASLVSAQPLANFVGDDEPVDDGSIEAGFHDVITGNTSSKLNSNPLAVAEQSNTEVVPTALVRADAISVDNPGTQESWQLRNGPDSNGNGDVITGKPPSLLAPKYQSGPNSNRRTQQNWSAAIRPEALARPTATPQPPTPLTQPALGPVVSATSQQVPQPKRSYQGPLPEFTFDKAPTLGIPTQDQPQTETPSPPNLTGMDTTPPAPPTIDIAAPDQPSTLDQLPGTSGGPPSQLDPSAPVTPPAAPMDVPAPPTPNMSPVPPDIPATELPSSFGRDFDKEIGDIVEKAETRAPNVTEIETTRGQIEFDGLADDNKRDDNGRGRGKPGKPGGKTIDVGLTIGMNSDEAVSSSVDADGNLTVTVEAKDSSFVKGAAEAAKFGGSYTDITSVEGNSVTFGLPPAAQAEIRAGSALPDKANLDSITVPGTSVKESTITSGTGHEVSGSFRAEYGRGTVTTSATEQSVERTNAETVTVTDAESETVSSTSGLGIGIFGFGGNDYNKNEKTTATGTDTPYGVGSDNQNQAAVQAYADHLAGRPAAVPEVSNQFSEVTNAEIYGYDVYASGNFGKDPKGAVKATDATEHTLSMESYRTDALSIGGGQVSHTDTRTFAHNPIAIDGHSELSLPSVSMTVQEQTTYDGGGSVSDRVTLSTGDVTIDMSGEQLRESIDHLRDTGIDPGPLADSISKSNSIAWGARNVDNSWGGYLFGEEHGTTAPATRGNIAELTGHLADLGPTGTYDQVPATDTPDEVTFASGPTGGQADADAQGQSDHGYDEVDTSTGDSNLDNPNGNSNEAATTDDGYAGNTDTNTDDGYTNAAATSDDGYDGYTNAAATSDDGYTNDGYDENTGATTDDGYTNDGYDGYTDAAATTDDGYDGYTDAAGTSDDGYTNDGYDENTDAAATTDDGYGDAGFGWT